MRGSTVLVEALVTIAMPITHSSAGWFFHLVGGFSWSKASMSWGVVLEPVLAHQSCIAMT
jgi:hypothetical protein